LGSLTLALVILTLVMIGGQAGWRDNIKKSLSKTKSAQMEKS
jgi:hypothetical protein